MAIKPHPDFEEIKHAVATLSKKGRSFFGVCYRCSEPQFAGQIVSGRGSQLHGARWTPKNSLPTVYLCESVEAAHSQIKDGLYAILPEAIDHIGRHACVDRRAGHLLVALVDEHGDRTRQRPANDEHFLERIAAWGAEVEDHDVRCELFEVGDERAVGRHVFSPDEEEARRQQDEAREIESGVEVRKI